VPAIEGCASLYERGVAQGVFRSGLDPVDLHMSISRAERCSTSPTATPSALIFQRDLDTPRR
jgi:hypothetical protein